MTAPALPGTLRDLLAVGMTVYQHTDWLHAEHDPEVWRPSGGIIHSLDGTAVGTVTVGVPGGLVLDMVYIDTLHDCDDETCLYRPQLARPADIRYTARWLLRTVGRGKGRLTPHDRRLIHVAVTLLTKAVV